MGLRKKLGVQYQRQYCLNGKFYDFYLPRQQILVQIDGKYWHGKNLKYCQKNVMQMKNRANDMYKDQLAKMRGIPLFRIWQDQLTQNRVRMILEGKEK